MTDEKAVYATEADRYEALISREDYQHNIPAALEKICPPTGLDVIDLGAGTGRLAEMVLAQAASVRAFDISRHMLAAARNKLKSNSNRNLAFAAADHKHVPVPSASADLVVSGWSVSYLAVWKPEAWRSELDGWLTEMKRVLRPEGRVVLFESLGTGNENPVRLPHLANFYPWLDEAGFQQTWIRTDYRFDSIAEAADLAGFFFGKEMAERIRNEQLTVLPECTGIWWMTLPAS